MKKHCVFPVSAGWLLLGWVTCLPPVQALVLYPSADPTFNTTAPGGALAGSGWQYTGYFQSFTGYPISPDAFVVSKHVVGGLHQGGAGGTLFSYLGTT